MGRVSKVERSSNIEHRTKHRPCPVPDSVPISTPYAQRSKFDVQCSMFRQDSSVGQFADDEVAKPVHLKAEGRGNYRCGLAAGDDRRSLASRTG